MTGLTPMTPREAKQQFLDVREDESSPETTDSYHYRLNSFVEWCEQAGILNLNDLSGRDLHRYRQYRKSDVEETTLKNNLRTLKQYLQLGVALEAVEPVIPELIEQMIPSIGKAEERSEAKLTRDEAHVILDYMERFQYASREHALLILVWDTGCRRGGLHSLDRDDFDEEDGTVYFEHRPDDGTRLKNKTKSNRLNALDEITVRVLADYVAENRTDTVGDHGREPLFTTSQGRAAKTTITRTVYRVTQPCYVGECPHDREPSTCEATQHGYESKCPSSLSPHPIRTGRISDLRDRGASVAEVAGRVDATEQTIRSYYDMPDHRQRMESRRESILAAGI